MAYNFTGTNEFTLGWSLPNNTGPYSISLWIKPTTAVANRTIFSGPGGGLQFRLETGDQITLIRRAQALLGTSSGTVTDNVWQQIGFTYASGGPVAFYIAGGASGSTAVSSTFVQTPLSLGSGQVLVEPFIGLMAEFAMWTAVLTVGEMAALGRGYSPAVIRADALIDYIPLIRTRTGRMRSEAIADVTGTAVADHPRVIYPRSRRIRPSGVELFFMQPDADSSDGTWTDQDGGTSLFAAIDETTIDDADYIKSATAPVYDICKIRLSDPTVTPAQPFMVRYRYRKTGTAQIDLIVRLLEGTTEIAAWPHTDVADTFVTAEQTLSGGEFAAIGDFNNLFIEFNANAP